MITVKQRLTLLVLVAMYFVIGGCSYSSGGVSFKLTGVAPAVWEVIGE